MRKTVFFVFFVSLVVSNLSAQNWDINTLHRVNSWDNKFVRNYNKFISRSEPYVAIGDRKSTRLNSSHSRKSRMPSSA